MEDDTPNDPATNSQEVPTEPDKDSSDVQGEQSPVKKDETEPDEGSGSSNLQGEQPPVKNGETKLDEVGGSNNVQDEQSSVEKDETKPDEVIGSTDVQDEQPPLKKDETKPDEVSGSNNVQDEQPPVKKDETKPDEVSGSNNVQGEQPPVKNDETELDEVSGSNNVQDEQSPVEKDETEPEEVSGSNNVQGEQSPMKNDNKEASAKIQKSKEKHIARGKELSTDSGDIVPTADSGSEEGKDKPGDVVRTYTDKDFNPDEEREVYEERDPNEFPILISRTYYSADSIESLDTSMRDSTSELKFTPSGQILQRTSIQGVPGDKGPFVDEQMDIKKTAKTRFSLMDKKEKAKVKAKHKDTYQNIRHYDEDLGKNDDDVVPMKDPTKDSEQQAKEQSEAIAELERSLLPEQTVPPWVLSDEDIEYPDYYYYFRSKSDVKFDCTSVAELIQEVLNDELHEKVYTAEESGTWTKNIANTLRNRVKELGFKRYKYVVQVVLGENIGAGIRTASRCMWDADGDNHASDTYTNDTIFCMSVVYAVYYY